MEQEKIGKFILKLRKEKNMTQVELASKIQVTDRAISKWENGRGMPDLALMKPLCKELGITINELLSGEKIDETEYQEKFEENVLNAIDYTDKKTKKNHRKVKIAFGAVIALVIALITTFYIDVSRMNRGESVLFSTWGTGYTPLPNLQNEEIEIVLKRYLVNIHDNEPKHQDHEKNFVSMRIYLIDEKVDQELYTIYAWVVIEKHYIEDDAVKQEEGSSFPFKFSVKSIDHKYIVTDARSPRDGSFYAVDMNALFPKSVRNLMGKVYADGTVAKLKLDIQQQVKLYFHK